MTQENPQPKQFEVRKNERGEQVTQFGLHFLGDGKGGWSDMLQDKAVVKKFLQDVVELLNMTVLGPFEVTNASAVTEKDSGGYSSSFVIQDKGIQRDLDSEVVGGVNLTSSHIAIHTFTAQRVYFIDVFSCNDYSEMIPALENLIKETFGYTELRTQIINRMVDYPMEPVPVVNKPRPTE